MRFFALLIISLLLLTAPAQATESRTGDWVGSIGQYTVKAGDTLFGVAQDFNIGIVELIAANPGVDLRQPAPGTELTLPKAHLLPSGPRTGIVVNIPMLRLFYFPSGGGVFTFPITSGKQGWETPAGRTTVTAKREKPTWYVPDSIRLEDPKLPAVVPPGPDNPLGEYALNLGWPGYLIHGTNNPKTVGKWASHGCIRLFPSDIKMLFETVPVGTPVHITDKPYALGWKDGTLYLQILPVRAQVYEMIDGKTPTFIDIPAIYGDVKHNAGNAVIDWKAVDAAIRRRSGMPVAVAAEEKKT